VDSACYQYSRPPAAGTRRLHWDYSVLNGKQAAGVLPSRQLKAHVTELMRQDLGANSSTSTHGPWSGHQIIQYRLSDVWKIKHAVAVMTADTIHIYISFGIQSGTHFSESHFSENPTLVNF
jgi:hypothetical protein